MGSAPAKEPPPEVSSEAADDDSDDDDSDPTDDPLDDDRPDGRCADDAAAPFFFLAIEEDEEERRADPFFKVEVAEAEEVEDFFLDLEEGPVEEGVREERLSEAPWGSLEEAECLSKEGEEEKEEEEEEEREEEDCCCPSDEREEAVPAADLERDRCRALRVRGGGGFLEWALRRIDSTKWLCSGRCFSPSSPRVLQSSSVFVSLACVNFRSTSQYTGDFSFSTRPSLFLILIKSTLSIFLFYKKTKKEEEERERERERERKMDQTTRGHNRESETERRSYHNPSCRSQ